MDRSTDTEVVNAALAWLAQDQPVYLVTVAGTWGSAPRRPGALMVIHPDGRFVGSVSGGCIEDDLVQRVLRGEFQQQAPQFLEYGVSGDSARRIGLPCGGRLQLVLEVLDTAAPLARVKAAMDKGERLTRRVCLATSETSLHPATDDADFRFDGDNLFKVFGPAWRMLIIGAGELSRRVAQLALTLDYAVTICDSRPEYADGFVVDGCHFDARPPAQCLADFAPNRNTTVLALSHSPALDDAALAGALQTDAFYVGALGSQRNQAARLKRLRETGLNETQLARLQGPVGLAIGSRTPAEIAIAIMAGLIEARNLSSHRDAEGAEKIELKIKN